MNIYLRNYAITLHIGNVVQVIILLSLYYQKVNMLSQYLHQITGNVIFLSFTVVIILYLVYMIVVKVLLYQYKNKYQNLPVHYKVFRMYNKNLISNTPSRKEKNFYIQMNKITLFFNVMLIATSVVFLFFCFR